jgi:hypothetical protein
VVKLRHHSSAPAQLPPFPTARLVAALLAILTLNQFQQLAAELRRQQDIGAADCEDARLWAATLWRNLR